ncbi:MAG: MerR family DNA-binding transcriptional regulator [Betaproteobacteria bacterium]|nr:MerR family DNA-binding transcriptional regulator [Betaproteobacteria bacterium]
MDDKFYTIKQTALITGLTEDTLRYYERIGLVGPIARAASGHRRYNAVDHTWIDFLTKMLSTGMTRSRWAATSSCSGGATQRRENDAQCSRPTRGSSRTRCRSCRKRCRS